MGKGDQPGELVERSPLRLYNVILDEPLDFILAAWELNPLVSPGPIRGEVRAERILDLQNVLPRWFRLTSSLWLQSRARYRTLH